LLPRTFLAFSALGAVACFWAAEMAEARARAT
jgi:hypothetical protein